MNAISTVSATIRQMRWWDIAEVHAIETDAFPNTAWSIEMFWSELAGVPENRMYFVAADEVRILGYAGILATAPDADVQTIAVMPRARRSGIGQLLLEQLHREACKRGCRRIHLEVAASNDEAQAMYERNKYELVSTRRDYYGKGADALVMGRTLGRP